jgi:hypothetical protein
LTPVAPPCAATSTFAPPPLTLVSAGTPLTFSLTARDAFSTPPSSPLPHLLRARLTGPSRPLLPQDPPPSFAPSGFPPVAFAPTVAGAYAFDAAVATGPPPPSSSLIYF